ANLGLEVRGGATAGTALIRRELRATEAVHARFSRCRVTKNSAAVGCARGNRDRTRTANERTRGTGTDRAVDLVMVRGARGARIVDPPEGVLSNGPLWGERCGIVRGGFAACREEELRQSVRRGGVAPRLTPPSDRS